MRASGNVRELQKRQWPQLRRSTASARPAISVVGPKRSLDFEVADEEEQLFVLRGLQAIVAELQGGRPGGVR